MNHKSLGINRFFRRITQNCDKWIGPVGFILGVTFAVTIGIPTGIDIYQNWQNLDPKDRSQAGITLIQTVATIVGGIAIFWNIVLSRRQLAASQEQNITERFSVAVEQLGHEQTAVRIGGIYSLERIAQDSPRDYWSIMEVLAAFVKDRRSFDSGETGTSKPPSYDKDIQSAIIVLGRRNVNNDPEGSSLYLSYTDLRGVGFSNANYNNVRFQKCDLWESNFRNANLQGSKFWQANLVDVKFHGANLSKATLEEANLQGADLRECILKDTNVKGTNFLNVRGLTIKQIKSASNWQTATYDDNLMVQLGLKANA